MELISDEEKAYFAAKVDKEMAWAEEVVNSNDPNNPWTETAEMMMKVGRDERLKAILRSRRKYVMDMHSDLATLVQRGRTEGNIYLVIFAVKKALKDGMSIADIAANTGFSHEGIEILCNQDVGFKGL